MATLIQANGDVREVSAKSSEEGFTLEELTHWTHCEMVQAITLKDGRTMWMDEEGKLRDVHHVNEKASQLLFQAGGIPGDYVVGDVLVTSPGEVQ